ncbi:hypothetical protein BDK51DRAFT_31797 [Blyttiomyces helicus]|uniref:Uncharacterized protein n=1 Tax=Blyttiomyces helicus TaxID=388810 RepID=A0A4P9WM47_9FUNG|nr:hypothetical protein BDK51DRAFT_31797 [Blyttiomyces helicus]|eukprot:RKO93522.1 hypothetical protein BDK51DRAFT_31797 [Blyttiomyces helicus]
MGSAVVASASKGMKSLHGEYRSHVALVHCALQPTALPGHIILRYAFKIEIGRTHVLANEYNVFTESSSQSKYNNRVRSGSFGVQIPQRLLDPAILDIIHTQWARIAGKHTTLLPGKHIAEIAESDIAEVLTAGGGTMPENGIEQVDEERGHWS